MIAARKRLEQVTAQRIRNTGTVVGDRNLNATGILGDRDMNRPVTGIASVFLSIVEKVLQNLGHGIPVKLYRRQFITHQKFYMATGNFEAQVVGV